MYEGVLGVKKIKCIQNKSTHTKKSMHTKMIKQLRKVKIYTYRGKCYYQLITIGLLTVSNGWVATKIQVA